jgi:hypothetical protein
MTVLLTDSTEYEDAELLAPPKVSQDICTDVFVRM